MGQQSHIAGIVVHCTETPTPDVLTAIERLQQIRHHHTVNFGFTEIGYHYLVAQDGSLWEGRPPKYVGAHVKGHNENQLGVAVIGTPNRVTREQRLGLKRLLTGLCERHGLDPSAVTCHWDHRPTTCPGRFLASEVEAWRAENGSKPI